MGLIDNVNVQVNGSGDIVSTLQSYITKILKPNIVDGRNVLEQWMVSAENTKYVIKYDFTLNGGTIEMPENCIIEIDGGSINNGTLVGDDTKLLNVNDDGNALEDTTLDGTWEEIGGIDKSRVAFLADEDGEAVIPDFDPVTDTVWNKEQVLTPAQKDNVLENVVNKTSTNGMAHVVLRADKTFEEQVTQENTVYHIRYDYTLGANVTIPANSVLEFDGGSLSSAHTLTGTNTGIEAGLVKIFPTNITLDGSWNVAEAYPEWFGAVSNGIVECSNAINAAIKISNVYLSDGTYLISNPIIIDIPKRSILGKYKYSSIIAVDSNFDPTVSAIQVNAGYVSLKNLRIADNTENRSQWTIYLNNAHSFSIDSCNLTGVENADEYCLYGLYNGDRTSDNNIFVTQINNSRLQNFKVLLKATDSYITNNEIWITSLDYAIGLYGGSQIIQGNQIVGGSKAFIYLFNANNPSQRYTIEGVKIINNYFDGSYNQYAYGVGILTENMSVVDSFIANNIFWMLKNRAIELNDGTAGVNISNNNFKECSYYVDNNNKSDILINNNNEQNTQGNLISANIFLRSKYLDSDMSIKTRTTTSPIFNISTIVGGRPTIVTSNVIRSTTGYVNAVYSGTVMVANNNNDVFNSTAISVKSNVQKDIVISGYDAQMFINTVYQNILSDHYMCGAYGAKNNPDADTINEGGNAYFNVTNATYDSGFIVSKVVDKNPAYATQVRFKYNGGIEYRRKQNGTWGNWIHFGNVVRQGESLPTLQSHEIGVPYFDVNSGKPIWWNGTAWVDATGATV